MNDETLSVIDISALPVEEGDESMVLAMLTGIQTPFAGPNGQPVTLPTKVYRVRIGKSAAKDLAASLDEQADKLADPKRPSGLVVPGSPADVDQVAANLNQFK
jgi:hypothetical protein